MKNQAEETQMILSAAQMLDEDTVIEKLPFLSSDEVKTVKERRSAEDLALLSGKPEGNQKQPEEPSELTYFTGQ